MLLPYFQAKENSRTQLKVFTGLDRRDKISDSSFTEMVNMTADSMPSIAPREARKLIASVDGATTICPPEYTGGELSSFTGVRDTTFYYNGSAISGELTVGKKSIADFNGKICIFPDKVYYDYLPSVETGEISNALVSMEKKMTVTGASFYSSANAVTGEYTSYISLNSAGFDNNFRVGDSLVISGCSTEKNNTKSVESRKDFASNEDIISVVVEAVSDNRMDVLLYNKNGEKVKFTNAKETGDVTVKIAIPDMDNVCVHNNRLWGTAASGECIYASKLGDCTNFHSFQGLSDDSWYGTVGTGGNFTGICSYRTAVVAFKRGCIHHIYGDAPINYSMPKQTAGGCIDGRSICEIEGVLYYLSADGFKAYSGGEPYSISPNLVFNYVSCASGSDGRHYYASAAREDGERDVLVYTPDMDVWVREDDAAFEGFCTYNGGVYGIADGKMWKMKGGTEPVEWSVVSKRFTYDMIDHKGMSCIWLRMDVSDGASLKVSVSADGGKFTEFAHIANCGFYVYRVPVRFCKCDSFRIKLEGIGKTVVHDIEIASHNGGRTM